MLDCEETTMTIAHYHPYAWAGFRQQDISHENNICRAAMRARLRASPPANWVRSIRCYLIQGAILMYKHLVHVYNQYTNKWVSGSGNVEAFLNENMSRRKLRNWMLCPHNKNRDLMAIWRYTLFVLWWYTVLLNEYNGHKDQAYILSC